MMDRPDDPHLHSPRSRPDLALDQRARLRRADRHRAADPVRRAADDVVQTVVDVHNWIGFVLIANFFVWLVFYLFTDKIKVYHPELSPTRHFRNSCGRSGTTATASSRGDPNPHQSAPTASSIRCRA